MYNTSISIIYLSFEGNNSMLYLFVINDCIGGGLRMYWRLSKDSGRKEVALVKPRSSLWFDIQQVVSTNPDQSQWGRHFLKRHLQYFAGCCDLSPLCSLFTHSSHGFLSFNPFTALFIYWKERILIRVGRISATHTHIHNHVSLQSPWRISCTKRFIAIHRSLRLRAAATASSRKDTRGEDPGEIKEMAAITKQTIWREAQVW